VELFLKGSNLSFGGAFLKGSNLSFGEAFLKGFFFLLKDFSKIFLLFC
jgi:hypothetical protein